MSTSGRRSPPDGPSGRHNIVHAVDPFEQRTLAASTGTDKRRDSLAWDLKVQIMQRLKVPIPCAEVGQRDERLERFLLFGFRMANRFRGELSGHGGFTRT